MNEADRCKSLVNTSVLTIILNVILAVSKISIGLIYESIAVISDGLNSLSDIFTTGLVIFGIKVSSEKSDEAHPYGHFRIESLVSLLIAAVLTVTAGYISYISIVNLVFHKVAQASIPAIIVTCLSITIKELIYRYSIKKARLFSSTSMEADAWHQRIDGISSVSVLIGVCGTYFGLWYLEPVAALVVAAMIIRAAIPIFIKAINQLIDHSADKDTEAEIIKITKSISGVENVDIIKTRISSNVIFVELEISVNSYISVSEGHVIAEAVNSTLENSGLSIEHCSVHVNPLA